MERSGANFEDALEALAQAGINWLAYVPANVGPASPFKEMSDAKRGLLLFLALGPRFGSQTAFDPSLLSAEGQPARSETEPFDTRSRSLVGEFVARWLQPHDGEACIVYPGETLALDLRGWLEAGRVQYRSRLGIGIRPDCGTWMAVRAAVWTALRAERRETLALRFPPLPEGGSPCECCRDTPCVRSCPAGAVQAPSAAPERPSDGAARDAARVGLAASGKVGAKSLELCMEHRLEPVSSCALRCAARLACPVGQAFRYPEAQLAYHYAVSLRAIRQWRNA